jgi:hypothetical protein
MFHSCIHVTVKLSVKFHTTVLQCLRGIVCPHEEASTRQRVNMMKSSVLHRLHIGMLTLSVLWALLCLLAPAVRDTAIVTAIAWGPFVSYCIAAWLIAQLRRDVPHGDVSHR